MNARDMLPDDKPQDYLSSATTEAMVGMMIFLFVLGLATGFFIGLCF